ncbi:MAG TPA: signal peptidase I [Myxococcaceae bacterium]|nr:signal peptidase I [Myxococcaceae bacterium]
MTAPPAPAGPDERLSAVLLQRRDGHLQQLHRRAELEDRVTSLWTPVVVFLAAFVPYVFIVELWPSSATWAQPTIKTVGLLMVVWYFAALGYRMARPEFRELRKARVGAEELLLQAERELQRRGVEKATREKLLDQAAAVDRSRAGTDAKKIQADVDRLTGLADKYLEGWRTRSSVAGVRGLLLTLLGVAVLRTVVVEPFKIPSGSMIPTLEIGDHVVVNRFIYGVRIPWMNVVPFVLVRHPRAGDVVVFNNPRNESVDFIKRVVAVPGDEVKQVDETIYVNGKPLPRTLVKEDQDVWTQDEQSGEWIHQLADRYREQGPYKAYDVLQGPNRRTRGQTLGPWKVPPESVMVFGDDRDNSSDSRYGFAVEPQMVSYVPYGHIKGKAMVVWLSLCHDGLGSGLPFWPFKGDGLCPGRMFTPVR